MALQGLTVGADQTLRLNGARFRNIGVNYGGGIVRIYSQSSTTACAYTPSAEQDAVLDYLVSIGVKCIRVKAFPYYPAQWTYGVLNGKAWNVATALDREAHYLAVDAFLAKCRLRGIGVILNLFFRIATIPDLVGGNNRTWLSAGNTRTFATTITQEIVTRYLNEQAVYGWEFSNEVNHYNDATDVTKGDWPGINVAYGTAASYSAATTCFNGSEWSTVASWWYGVVAAIDNQRICLTGNGPNSYTQPGGTQGVSSPIRNWELEQVRDNPLNSGCIHYYGNIGYGSSTLTGLNSVLTAARHWQGINGRAFVLGEFGNQPRKISSIVKSGATATVMLSASSGTLLNQAGDTIHILGTGTTWDSAFTVQSVATDRLSCVIRQTNGPADYSGDARLIDMDVGRTVRVINDVQHSGTDLALWWCVDLDPLTPVGESIYPGAGLDWQGAAIRTVNAQLN